LWLRQGAIGCFVGAICVSGFALAYRVYTPSRSTAS
jgi:hypothetical protein